MGGVAGELFFLEPSRVDEEKRLALGVNFFAVLAPRRSPMMVGLGGGFMSVSRRETRGPVVWVLDGQGLAITTTTVGRSVELRHVEALFRFQPFWGTVRPFVEGAVGMIALWDSAWLDDASGETLISVEGQRDMGLMGGGTLGVDLQLFPMRRDETGTYGLLLTAGVRRWFTSPLDRPTYVAADDGTATRDDLRQSLRMWAPFVALSFGVDARAEARAPAAHWRSEDGGEPKKFVRRCGRSGAPATGGVNLRAGAR